MSPTTSTPEAAAPIDSRVEVALAALAEVTDAADVGALLEVEEAAPGVVDLRFACTMAGYPGWRWTVSTSALERVEPTVLEVALLPGEGSLLAPPWVPWTERLAEWRRTHANEDGPAEADVLDVDDDLEDDDLEVDEDDLDAEDLEDDEDLDVAEIEGDVPESAEDDER